MSNREVRRQIHAFLEHGGCVGPSQYQTESPTFKSCGDRIYRRRHVVEDIIHEAEAMRRYYERISKEKHDFEPEVIADHISSLQSAKDAIFSYVTLGSKAPLSAEAEQEHIRRMSGVTQAFLLVQEVLEDKSKLMREQGETQDSDRLHILASAACTYANVAGMHAQGLTGRGKLD